MLHACAGSDFALPMLPGRKQHTDSAKPPPKENSYVQELPYDPLAEAFNDAFAPCRLLGGMEHADSGDEKSTTQQQDVKRTAAIRYGLVPQEIDRDGNCLEGTKLQIHADSSVRSSLTAANELLQGPELSSTTALVEALKDPDRKDHEVLRTILRQYNAWLQSDRASRFTADHWLEYATLSSISPAQDNKLLLQQHTQVWKAKLSKSHLTSSEAVERFLETINVTAIRDEKARQECIQQLKGLLSQKAWQADSFLTELLLSALYQIAKDHGVESSSKQALKVLEEVAQQSRVPKKTPPKLFAGFRTANSQLRSPRNSPKSPSVSPVFADACRKWFKTHSLPPHSNVVAQTDERATAPSQTKDALFTVVKTHLTEVHSRVDTQITEMMKTVAT
ncbi:MAG: hypothetical protein AAFP93_03255, partial [Bacteroidota bacterium]